MQPAENGHDEQNKTESYNDSVRLIKYKVHVP